MNFIPTDVEGVWIVESEIHSDERGSFFRTWCSDALRHKGLAPKLDQCSISSNPRRGTVRGMHYQASPHGETKHVRCIRGAIYDVAIDLRPDSPTFGKWTGVELSAKNKRSLYIPEGCAHGFQTLEPDSDVLYMIDGIFHPQSSRGVRWNDPHFKIAWPLVDLAFLSPKDATLPDYK